MDDKPQNTTNEPQNTNQASDWLVGGGDNTQQGNVNSDVGAQPPASPSIEPNADNIQSDDVQDTPDPVQPENAFVSPAIVGPHSSGGGGGFKAFVIIGVLAVLAIWGGVGYLYYQNRTVKTAPTDGRSEEQVVQTTPTPVFTPDQIKIKSGSIVHEKPDGEIITLVSKDDHPSTGIIGFLKVAVSPDYKKLCFESWSPAPDPALYISDIDGQNVIEVSANRQSCLWSNDSNRIFYTNTSTKTSPVNIFRYDLTQATESDMTGNSVPAGVVRRFEIVGFSADSSKLICSYENLGGAAASETMSQCEIDLQTGEVSQI